MSFLDQMTQDTINAPLLIPPPDSFPVTERVDATITYHLPPTSGGLMDWLKQHQTAVMITAAGLFVLALMKQRRR